MSLSDTEILTFLPSIRRAAKNFAKGSQLDAEDLTQGAVEKIIRAQREWDGVHSPAWMMSVAQHHFVDERRKMVHRETEALTPEVFGEEGDEDFSSNMPMTQANGDDAVALSEALNVLDQTKAGRELVAFVVNGEYSEEKKARYATRRNLRRVMQ